MPTPPKQQKPLIYYSHPMCLYGHALEREHLRCIRAAFPSHEIINPGAPEYDEHPKMKGGGARAMAFCIELVNGAEGVVFSRLLGEVTAGVGAEVNRALEAGKDVFELRDEGEHWHLERVTQSVAYLSPAASRDLYRKFEAC